MIDEGIDLGTSQPKGMIRGSDMLDLAHQREAENYCD
jgi:hypothetical protein